MHINKYRPSTTSTFKCLLLTSILSCCTSPEGNETFLSNVAEPTMKMADDSHMIKFDLKNNMRDNVFDVIDSIRLVPLEQKENSIIGSLNDIKIIDTLIYATDMYKAQAVFVFDASGKYIRRIGNMGHGPGEYVSINSIDVSEDHIDILDWAKLEFMRYGIDGKCMKTIDVSNLNPDAMMEKAPNEWLMIYQRYNEKHPYRLVVTDSTFNTLASAFPFTYTRSQVVGTIEKCSDGELCFYYPLCDTIYTIGDSVLTPKYCLGFYGKDDVRKHIESTNDLSRREYFDKSNSADKDIIHSYTFHECRGNCFVQYRLGHSIYSSLIDGHTGKSMNFRCGDTDKKDNAFPIFINDFIDDNLVAAIDGNVLRLMSEKSLNSFLDKLSEQGKSLVKQMMSDDGMNPAICMMHINTGK